MRIGKKKGRGREIAWGLLLLAGAAALVLSKVPGFELPLLGEFTWFQIVVLVGCVWFAIKGLLDMEFFNLMFSLAVGYLILDQPMGWPEIDTWIVLVSALLAAIGLHSIFRRKWSKGIEIHIGDERKHRAYDEDIEGYARDVEYQEADDDDCPGSNRNTNQRYYGREVVFTNKTMYTGTARQINGEYVFSGVNVYVEGQEVEDINCDVVFSRARFYFDSAALHNNYAELHTDVVFSNLKVYVPSNWNVIDETGRVFGHSTSHAETYREGAPTLCIKGDCVFGGVHVKRV